MLARQSRTSVLLLLTFLASCDGRRILASSKNTASAKHNRGSFELADDPLHRVMQAKHKRQGDFRFSVLPNVIEAKRMAELSKDFFAATGLLYKDGNTFGPGFEDNYIGHKNYFYYVNSEQVVPGAEVVAPIFHELERYTRAVVEMHHPGVKLTLDRAFGSYYETARDGFHPGVNKHNDGGANVVSTLVHATMPNGLVGFSEGGELVVSEDGVSVAIPHNQSTVGSIVYLGAGRWHHAEPIGESQQRLVFNLFYTSRTSRGGGPDLYKHALAA